MEHPPKAHLEDELDDAPGPEAEPAGAPVEALADDLDELDFEGPAAPAPPPESRGLADMLRKAMVAGLGAVFMTEEGIRAYVKDLKLPKDVMGFVVGQAGRSKDELFRVIGEELRRFFESEVLHRELARLLSQVTIEINAQVRLRPDGKTEQKIEVRPVPARRAKAKKRKKG
jgi:hypothetical protein